MTIENDESETPEASTDIESIVDEIDEESPEPNQAAIDGFKIVQEVPISGAESTNASSAQPSAEGLNVPRDRFGNPFDPALHHTNDDGTPKLFKGKLRRKRQSKIGTGSSPEQSSAAGPGQLTPIQQANARRAGRVMADSFISVACMIGGDEFQPIKGTTEQGMRIDERGELQSAFADYCEVKGVTDFPPGIALAMALTGYVGPRFMMPQTQRRSRRFFGWIAGKFKNWRSRRAAYADNRDDGKRKNDTGEAISDEAAR